MDVPDYNWHAGCFGTACGNLMGYWDRNGMDGFYTGLTGGGVAPLSDYGADAAIRSLWASQKGLDGRPSDQPGHWDDYWDDYEWTLDDPHVRSNRTEHPPDCVGDFIGLNQKRWTNMNGECDGNIDGYVFAYWDPTGSLRHNFTPPANAGLPARDLQSGLRAWTQSRGYDADVFTQLTDFNSTVLPGLGFTYEDLKAEIDAGWPVLLFLQSFTVLSANRPGRLPGHPTIARGNPPLHGMLAYGYLEQPEYGKRYVYYRTSWRSGDGVKSNWAETYWQASMPLRGVIGYHPKPRVCTIARAKGKVALTWEGPNSRLVELVGGIPVATNLVHRYQVERATSLTSSTWMAVGEATTNRIAALLETGDETVFYRIRLLAGAAP